MTRDRREIRETTRAVLLAAIMIVSVFGGTMAFAGSAAATAGNITISSQPGDVEIGQQSTEQTLTTDVEVGSNGGTANITITGDTSTVTDASVSISGDDVIKETNASVSEGTISFAVSDDGGNSQADTAAVDVTLTHDTSGEASESTGLSYSVNDGDSDVSATTDDFALADTNIPDISNPSPADGVFVNDTSQTYTVDISDSGSGVNASSIVVTVSDADGTPLDSVGTDNGGVSYSDDTLTIDSQTYADGVVTVTVDADDNAGNSADQFSSTFTVDTNSPSVGIESPADGAVVQSQGEISGTASDENEVSSVDLTIENSSGDTWDGESFTSTETTVATEYSGDGTWTYDSSSIDTDDTYTVSATATDVAENTATSDTVDYTIDTNSLSVGIDNPTDGDFVQSQTEISGTASDENGVSSVDLTIEDSDQNTWDGDSFTSADTTVAANYDSQNSTWTYDSSNITTEVRYTVTATATDVADNTATSDAVNYTIDTTDPTIDGLTASFDTNANEITVTVDASESLDPSETTVSIRNASDEEVGTVTGGDWMEDGKTYDGTFAVTQRTDETFSANLSAAADLAGNAVAEPGLNNDTVDVDTSALDLTIDSPDSQLNLTSTSEFDLQYSYSDTNPDSVTVELSDGGTTFTYDINDSQYANDNTQKTLTIDLSENTDESPILDDGTYNLTVTATDANSGTASTTSADLIVVDDTPPNFANFGQEDTSSTTTNFSIDITDSTSDVDESSITVDVTQDGVTQTLSGGDEGVVFDGGTLTVDTENSSLTLSEGPVTVNYTASDLSGNVAENDNNEFTINTAPPAIDSVEAEAGEDEVTVTFTEEVDANDGAFSTDDFAYTDVSGGDATEISSVSALTDNEGYTDEVTLTLDADVGADDLDTDEVNARQGAISDRNDNNVKSTDDDNNVKSTDAATVALADTTDPAAPAITAGNVTAENEGSYDVTVTGTTASTADIVVRNSAGEVSTQQTGVDLGSDSSATVEFDLTDIENGDVTIEANVTDIGADLTSDDVTVTVPKDNESATIESVTTDAGTDELEVTFSEDVKNVDGNLNAFDGENLTIDSVSGDGATYTLTVDEPIEPSDIDNESVTISATTDVEDIVGTQADTSAVTLADGSDPGVVSADSSAGSDTVELEFSESVYNGSDDGLSADNVTYVNNSGTDHTVESVEHAAGDTTATVTLDSSLTADDMNSDEIEVTANDSVDNQTTTSAVIREIVDISEFEVSNTTDTDAEEVRISFTSSDELDTFSVSLETESTLDEVDNVDTELDESDFDVTEQDDGTYDYAFNYTVPRDGRYNAELTSATAVGGSEAFETPDDSDSVDYADPEPVDAEIIGSDGAATDIAVQFNEPVEPVVSPNGQNITIAGESPIGLRSKSPNNWVFTFDGVVATGDAPDIAFDEETVEEVYPTFGDQTSVAGTSETVDTQEYHLSEGVNFVSVPAEFGTLDISESGFGDATVMTYEDGEWQTYAPDRNADNQDITSMEGGQGYIVRVDSDTTVDVTVRNEEPGDSAEDATPGQQQLQEGWNLVGHWQEGAQPAADGSGGALDSVGGDSTATNVFGQQDAGEFTYRPVYTFQPGEAYWVFVEDGEVYTASNYDRDA